MPRADLLSLSLDDLATLANRGLVKRAVAELDGAQVTYSLSENAAGTVSLLWSDDVHCLLPSNASLQNANCSCSATGVCRHLLRSVLAYQREHASSPTAQPTPPPVATAPVATAPVATAPTAPSAAPVEAPVGAWNPGDLSDDELGVVSAATLRRARALDASGQLIEVFCGARPRARFHTLGVHLRFLVPGDARYTHCDCAEAAPCVHVPLAVWAFRRLPAGENHGLIEGGGALAVPEELLDALEAALGELARVGVAGAESTLRDRWTRLEAACLAQELVWPADVAGELRRGLELHAGHNARFDAAQVARGAGELLARIDAIRARSGALPAVFVRGAAGDKTTEVGAARLIGLGTGALVDGRGVELRAWMQDSDSGARVFIARDFPDPVRDAATGAAPLSSSALLPAPLELWQLAAKPVVKGVGMGALGSGQVLARGGKRAPNGEFSFGRTPLSFNAQPFEWERLRAPLLCEGFGVADGRSRAAPAFLSPRRAGEDLHVVPLAGVENAHFARAAQEVRALLRDENGDTATLVFPFLSRAASGVEALLGALQSDSPPLFVAGRFSRGAQGLRVSPLSLVTKENGVRTLVQPWVSPRPRATGAALATTTFEGAGGWSESDPLRDFAASLARELGELWLLGLDRADERVARDWGELAHRGAALGFSRLLAPVERLAGQLALKSKTRVFDASPACAALFETGVLALVLEDL